MTSELIPSIALDELLARRNAVADRIRAQLKTQLEIQDLLAPIEHSGLHARLYTAERRQLDDAETAEGMVKRVDAAIWDHLLKLSGLWQLMDAAARREWLGNIDKATVPELTHTNVAATFEALHAGRALMFERGVVAVFRSLSWDYKTNTPVAFGKRLVLRRLVDGWGGWQYARPSFEGANALDDLLRVMHILDGKPEPHAGSFRTLGTAGWPKRDSVAKLYGMIQIRGFKNGNAHLTFLRMDLVDRMNAILAKHHPNALPPATEAA